MKTHFLFLFSLSCFSLFAQEKYQYALKLYNTSAWYNEKWKGYATYLGTNDTLIAEIKYRSFLRLHPSIAFNWQQKERIFQEIELSDFSAKKTTITSNAILPLKPYYMNNVRIAIRYEYLFRINKEDKKTNFFIGGSLSPYFEHVDYQFYSSIDFPRNFWTIGVKFHIIPRINIALSNRWFLDMNLPIGIFDQDMQEKWVQNPALPILLQKTRGYNFTPLPDIEARIGVGFKL